MSFEYYIDCGRKRLRCGYTTGTCAALAASGAAELLLTGKAPVALSVTTPKGPVVTVESVWCRMDEHGNASCGVRKDAGDDPDVTDGMIVAAEVSFVESLPGGEGVGDVQIPGGEGAGDVQIPDGEGAGLVQILGGEGVGIVTMPGLDQSVGSAAINSVPRRMIRESVLGVMKACRRMTPLKVVISIPDGEKIAEKTFNPHLGIVGGLSVLGTSGIVEPMSEQALLETIRLSLSQARAGGCRRVILVPGNYGLSYAESLGEIPEEIAIVKCSNYIGDALDLCAAAGFRQVLIVGHAGKLVKLAGGIMNTHSSRADCRRELITAHAALAGAPRELCAALMESAATTECFSLLKKAGLFKEVSRTLMDAVDGHLKRRAEAAYTAGALMYEGEGSLIGATKSAGMLLSEWGIPFPGE